MIALVLSRTLEPPPAESVRAAVEALTEIGALDGNEDMTPLGTLWFLSIWH
jgi:HrpA-like RNA helicase